MPGKFAGKDVTIVDVFEGVGQYSAGNITEEELKELECVACPAAGACAGQFTANTMATVSEAMGAPENRSGRGRESRNLSLTRHWVANLSVSRHRYTTLLAI